MITTTPTKLPVKTDKRIIMLDASALKELPCALKFYRTCIEGWRSKETSIDMAYGTAFHLFIAEMNSNGGQYPEAIRKAQAYFQSAPFAPKKNKAWMTAQHLLKTCMDYWEYYNGYDKRDEWKTVMQEATNPNYKDSPYKEPLVELKFAVPYFSNDKVEILLSGTVDDICKRQGNGCYAIRDFKTTSVWNADEYLSSYRLSPQLLLYVLTIYEYAKHYPSSIFGTICSQGRIGAMIDGIFLKAAGSEFQRSEVFFFSEKDLTEFKAMIDTIAIPRILSMLDAFPQKEGVLNGACTSVYGKCKFDAACKAPDSIAAQYILANSFELKPYDPLNFH